MRRSCSRMDLSPECVGPGQVELLAFYCRKPWPVPLPHGDDPARDG